MMAIPRIFSTASFSYASIQEVEIRLPYVVPGDFATETDDMYFNLETVSSKVKPSYKALSYTWEARPDPENTRQWRVHVDHRESPYGAITPSRRSYSLDRCYLYQLVR
jgi:hypothetical protein